MSLSTNKKVKSEKYQTLKKPKTFVTVNGKPDLLKIFSDIVEKLEKIEDKVDKIENKFVKSIKKKQNNLKE